MKARFTGLPFRVSFGLLLCLESLLRAQPVMPKSWEQSKDAPFALQQNSPDVFRIDVSNREQVRAFYNTVFQASEDVPMEWTGSYTTGDPGSTSLAYRQAVILRVNYFRAMAGVPANIVLNEVYSDKAEQAALMMSANDALNHFPPSDWTFFTEEGAEAASSSDLFLGVVGPDGFLATSVTTGQTTIRRGTAGGFCIHRLDRWGQVMLRVMAAAGRQTPFGCSITFSEPAQ
jgi:hypothetical protein